MQQSTRDQAICYRRSQYAFSFAYIAFLGISIVILILHHYEKCEKDMVPLLITIQILLFIQSGVFVVQLHSSDPPISIYAEITPATLRPVFLYLLELVLWGLAIDFATPDCRAQSPWIAWTLVAFFILFGIHLVSWAVMISIKYTGSANNNMGFSVASSDEVYMRRTPDIALQPETRTSLSSV